MVTVACLGDRELGKLRKAVEAHTCNLSTWKTKAGLPQVWAQCGLQWETEASAGVVPSQRTEGGASR